MAYKILPDTAYLRECFSYDPESGVLTWKIRPVEHFQNARVYKQWNSAWSGRVAGKPNPSGHLLVGLNHRHVYVHRVIWKIVTGNEPDIIDHKDHKTANNRWKNLRNTNNSGNQRNRKMKRNHPLGVKGVQKVRATGRFVAHININGTPTHIGSFKTKEEAHEAYCETARLHFKEFWHDGT